MRLFFSKKLLYPNEYKFSHITFGLIMNKEKKNDIKEKEKDKDVNDNENTSEGEYKKKRI